MWRGNKIKRSDTQSFNPMKCICQCTIVLVWACHDRQQKETVRFGRVTTVHRKLSRFRHVTIVIRRKLSGLGVSRPSTEWKLPSLGTSRPSTEESCPVWARHDRLQKEAVRFGHVMTVNRRNLSGLGMSRPSAEGSCPVWTRHNW